MSLQLARVLAIVGNQTKLATAAGVKPQAVQQWLRKGVPPERVIAVSAATHFRVTPHEIRPDLYPHPEDGLPPERRIFGVLAEFAATGALLPQEHAQLVAAFERGPAAAMAAIEALAPEIEIRGRLLQEAQRLKEAA